MYVYGKWRDKKIMIYDIDEMGAQLSALITKLAGERMPPIARLTVIDASQQALSGYVFCNYNGSTVRCWVGHTWDVSNVIAGSAAGQHVLFAIRETGVEGRGEFIAIAYGFNGLDTSHAPRQRVAATSYSPATQTTPSSGVTVSSNNEGQLIARASNGTTQVVNDDTAAWLAYFGG